MTSYHDDVGPAANVLLALVGPAAVPPLAATYYLWKTYEYGFNFHPVFSGLFALGYLVGLVYFLILAVRILPIGVTTGISASYFALVYFFAVYSFASLDVLLALAAATLVAAPGGWFGWLAARDLKQV